MEYLKFLENLNPAIYEQLKYSLEIGKWPNGELLTAHQKEIVMRSLINWGEIHLPVEQRIGYIDKGEKAIPFKEATPDDQSSLTDIISKS